MNLIVVEMIHLVIWIFIVYGTTQLLVETSMLSSLRDAAKKNWSTLYKLLTCFLCVSVWTSFALSWAFWSPTASFFYYSFDYLDADTVAGTDLFSVMKNLLSMTMLYLRKLLFMFADGMFGSAIVWLIHTWEIRNVTNN